MYHDKTYSNRALIPLWIAHLTFLLVLILVFALYMMEVAGDRGSEPPAYSAFMFFICVALVLEPLEMVLQSYRYLEPWLYLSFQVYKALLSVIFLIYEIYQYTELPATFPASMPAVLRTVWKWVVIVIIAFCACAMLSYFASLAYGAIVLRRHKKTAKDWDLVSKEANRDDDQ